MSNPPDAPMDSPSDKPSHFPPGAIAARLNRLDLNRPYTRTADRVEPFRQAAAVLVAVNPGNLKPVDAKTADISTTGVELLPELISSPYASEVSFPWTLPVGTRQRVLG